MGAAATCVRQLKMSRRTPNNPPLDATSASAASLHSPPIRTDGAEQFLQAGPDQGTIVQDFNRIDPVAFAKTKARNHEIQNILGAARTPVTSPKKDSLVPDLCNKGSGLSSMDIDHRKTKDEMMQTGSAECKELEGDKKILGDTPAGLIPEDGENARGMDDVKGEYKIKPTENEGDKALEGEKQALGSIPPWSFSGLEDRQAENGQP